MLLSAIRRPSACLLTVSPILWAGAVFPGAGLLLLVGVVACASRTGDGTLWAFLAVSCFFLGIFAYAFARAALSQQIHCRRDGSRLAVRSRTQQLEAELATIALRMERREVGVTQKVPIHVVVLEAPAWREQIIVHSGVTPWFARWAARRVGEHLGLDAMVAP